MRCFLSVSIFAIVVVMTSGLAPATAATPVPVSPGGATDFAPVHTACPTFSWGAVDGAAGYELVVYEVPEAELDGTFAVPDSPESTPALRQAIPAGALSWTPATTNCLEMFGRYAWTVRAVGGNDAWAESRMFQVDPDPLVRKIGGALESALGKYFEERGIAMGAPGELAALITNELNGQAIEIAEAPPSPKMVSYHGHIVAEPPGPQAPGLTSPPEFTLSQSGTAITDYAQLQFESPANAIDWAWVVSNSDGRFFLQGPPLGADAISFVGSGANIITTVDVLQTVDNVTVGSSGTQGELDVMDLTIAGLGNTSLCIDGSGPSKLGRCTSARRYKNGIENLNLGLEAVLDLRPVTFNWATDPGHRDLGFVAEEVAAVDPLLATFDENGAESGVKYRRMTALLAKAVQELSVTLETQNRKIEKLEARVRER